MLRFINICLVLGLVALACVIYQVKYQARGLDAEIRALNGQIDEERDAIAVLRAEWSLLNRPERIERLAQKHLKLAPAKPVQIVTLDKVTDRDFDRTRLEQAPPAPVPDSAPAAKSTPPGAKPKVSVASVPTGEAAAPWPEAKIVRPAEDPAQ
jgi:cell division protein FtsL